MKKLLLALLLSTQAFASNPSTITLGWNPIDASGSPAFLGYHLYQTSVSGQYTFGIPSANLVGTIPAGTQVFQVTGIPSMGNFYYVVTAYDSNGLESLPSVELQLPQLPGAPTGLKVIGR